MKKTSLLLCVAITYSLLVFAKNDPDSTAIMLEQYAKMKDSINNSMHYKTGAIELKGGMAKLTIPAGFKYLDIEQSRYILEDIWGNPKDEAILGMIFPEKGGPLEDSSYAFVITFEDMGYVKDDDANKIDYKELLDQMHKDEPAMNLQRQKEGYPSIHMVGWAQPPYYDEKNKILHWAKELKFGDADGSTLNYDIRILGRKGILSLNAIAGIDELPRVKKDIPKILNIAEFTDGNRYADFNDNTDKIAAYTVGGLVAGKVLLKVGFFAKFWKLILLAIAGIGGAIAKIFKKKKQPAVDLNPPPPSSSETPIA
jgi:uncharacterized membrane-anchored protein